MIIIIGALISSCGTMPPVNPKVDIAEPSRTIDDDVFTPTSQKLENTTAETSMTDTKELFSSDLLGLCFSYPKGFTQIPYNDAVEIVAPELQGTDLRGLFWLEISDSYNRTAEKIADQEMTYAVGLNVGRWNLDLDGEQAVVLDGMPGQDLQRRVYVVHQQKLYILAFTPTHSENKAAGDQMEILYTSIIISWAWSPCSGGKQTSHNQALQPTPASLSKENAEDGQDRAGSKIKPNLRILRRFVIVQVPSPEPAHSREGRLRPGSRRLVS